MFTGNSKQCLGFPVLHAAKTSRRMKKAWRKSIICNKPLQAALHAGIVFTPLGMNSRATPSGHSIEVCVPAHFALRMLLAFSQPVNCIFWPIETLNWLVAASKLHKHRGTCYTAEWSYCPFAILWLCPRVISWSTWPKKTLKTTEFLNFVFGNF